MRVRMPDLRAREASQLSAPGAQLAARDTHLKFAENLEGFLARLRTSAQVASTEDRLRVLRLLVKDVLIGPERLPAGTASRSGTPAPPSDHDIAEHDTEGEHRPGYPLPGRGDDDGWQVAAAL